MSSISIGWIGTGGMGLAMASNLQKHLSKDGKALRYWNRTIARGDPLKELEATPCPCLVDLVRSSTLLFSCTANDASVTSAIDQILDSLSADELKGKTYIEMSTVHPDTSAACAERLSTVGVDFLSCPVFGATVAAVNAQLVLLLSGPDRAKQVLLPFADGVLGRAYVDLGGDVKSAPLLKLAGNGMLLSLVECLSETYAVADVTGLGPEPITTFVDLMFGGVMSQYASRIVTGAYAPPVGQKPSFAVELAVKDGLHAQTIAKATGVPTPALDAAMDHLKCARTSKKGELDSTCMYGQLREEGGLNFFSDAVSETRK